MEQVSLSMNTKTSVTKLAWICLFAIAMGYLESAVVVYLREIFYPEGFAFPLKSMDGRITFTEVFRELATLVMLAGAGYLAGRTAMQRFGAFLLAFGIWDIFYYIFLYALLGWPESVLTWDILFLIPVIWVGPVVAPVINALTMCFMGGVIFIREEGGIKVSIGLLSWVLLILGSLVILVSYTMDYLSYMSRFMPVADLFRPSAMDRVMAASSNYIPEHFNWWIFGTGQSLLLVAVLRIFNGRK